VDLDANVIRVERAWDDVEGPVEGKTRAARRRVPITRELGTYLLPHPLRAPGVGDALVFGTTAISAFESSTVRRRALAAWAAHNEAVAQRAARERRKVEAAEPLRPIGLHECRHTFASLLIAAGVNAKATSTYMGHASVQITYDRYGHLMPGAEEEAAGLLDAYLLRSTLPTGI
jgi:integrase